MIPVPPSVLEQLAQAYGTEAQALQHFGGGSEGSDGVVYAFLDEKALRLLKILALRRTHQDQERFCLEERLRFMRFLGERGARVAYPRHSPQDQLYECVPDDEHLWVGYSMAIAPGRIRGPRRWTAGFFRAWGRTVGLLHRLAREYPSWRASVDPATGEELLTWRDEWETMHRWCQDEEVRRCWEDLRPELEGLPETRDAFGFVHNDLHSQNLLVDEGRITVLDFDVANHHWFVNDIAIACQSVLAEQAGGMGAPMRDPSKLLGFLTCFLDGYELEHQLEAEWLDRLDLFIAYRRILLFVVMHGWISARPDLHRTWKEMILTRPTVVGAFSGAP